MLPRVEVRVLGFLVGLELVKDLALLLLRQFLAVDASVLGGDGGEALRILRVFESALLRGCLLLHLGRLDVVFGRGEVEFDVGLDAADLVVRLRLQDVDRVLAPCILNVDRVSFVEDGVVSQLLLENGLWVGQVDEGRLVRLNLHVGSLLQVHVPQDDLRSFLDAEVVHHPDWDVAHSLLSGELEHAAISLDAHLRVANHEGHGVLDAQSGQLLEGRSRQDNLVSTVDLGFADEGGTVASVGAQEDVGGVGVAPADVAANALVAAPVVTLVLLTGSEE